MKINIDKVIINFLLILLSLKVTFSYLNVKLDWWQRHLIPNIEKFNFLGVSKDFTRNLEYIIIPLILFYLIKNHRYLGRFLISLFIITTLLFLNIITSFINDISIFNSIEYTIKFSFPVCFFICLIVHKKKYDYNLEKLARITIFFLLGLTMIGIVIFDPSYNHWENWLPIYFTSLHTHNYILVALGIGIAYILYKNNRFIYLCGFLIIYFLFLYFGYRIRSALFFYLVFVIGITYVIHNFFRLMWLKIIVIVPIAIAFYLTFSNNFDLNKYSSGRVTMYKAKIEMLKKYDLKEYLFGKGKGSDFIRTEDWWYDEKNSHNDLLTFLVENGFIYLILFVSLILTIVIFSRKINVITSSILVGYLSASFLSNGIPLRPLAGYILFLMLAFIYSDTHLNSKIYAEQK